MTSTREVSRFAGAVAVLLEAKVVELPDEGVASQWSLVDASGAHLLLVRTYAHGFGINLASGEAVEGDAAGVADAVRRCPETGKATVIELAYAVVSAARERLSHETHININASGDTYSEVSVESAECWIPLGGPARSALPCDVTRPGLQSRVDALVASIAEQRVAHAKDAVTSARLEQGAKALLRALVRDLPTPDGTHWGRLAYGDAAERHVEIHWGTVPKLHKVVDFDMNEGQAAVTIGAARIPLADFTTDDGTARVSALLQTLTVDRLETGRRYLVLLEFGGCKPGSYLTFDGVHWLHDRFPVQTFHTEEGTWVEVADNTLATIGNYLAAADT